MTLGVTGPSGSCFFGLGVVADALTDVVADTAVADTAVADTAVVPAARPAVGDPQAATPATPLSPPSSANEASARVPRLPLGCAFPLPPTGDHRLAAQAAALHSVRCHC